MTHIEVVKVALRVLKKEARATRVKRRMATNAAVITRLSNEENELQEAIGIFEHSLDGLTSPSDREQKLHDKGRKW